MNRSQFAKMAKAIERYSAESNPELNDSIAAYKTARSLIDLVKAVQAEAKNKVLERYAPKTQLLTPAGKASFYPRGWSGLDQKAHKANEPDCHEKYTVTLDPVPDVKIT